MNASLINKVTNVMILIAGFIFAGVGTVGMFLPILPTTPFYILATLCFAKSSAKFNSWFTSTDLYKKHIKTCLKNKGMTLKSKLMILIPVSTMLIFFAIIVDVLAIQIILLILTVIKNWVFIFKIKTV